MSSRLPSHARIVVVGGGVVGCSIAYHLALMGEKDVVLVERSALSSGTTWHSAGNMETYREDPLLYEIVRYGVNLFPGLEAESGQALGWKTTGRVVYTHLPERLESYRHVPKLADARGIEVEFMDGKGIGRHFPILNTTEILGGLWIPGDGRVNPTDLTTAFARAAKQRGVKIFENCAVKKINRVNGRTTGIETAEGEIKCEIVVVASGLWSSDLTATCGVRLPLYALEHLYLITKPIPEVPRDLPMFLAFDDYLYGREEVEGLIVGCLDKNALPIATRDLPVDFSFGLLNERWDQFEPYLATGLKRFPVLETAEIRMLLNGPECFTPDSQMLIGPVPALDGVFVAAGMNSNGIALSSGVGRLISEWIVEGRPSMDVSRLDVRRFTRHQATEHFMRRRATEIPSYCIEMHGAGEDFTTARDIRHSPLHRHIAGKGGRFKSICGWERAVWVNQTFEGGQNAEGRLAVDAEIKCWQTSLLGIDRSSDVKFRLEGPGSIDLINRLTNNEKLPETGQARAIPIWNDQEYLEALASLYRIDDNNWLLTAPVEQETCLGESLRKCLQVLSGCTIREVTTAYALLRIIGPEACQAFDQISLKGTMPNPAGDRFGNGIVGVAEVTAWQSDNGQSQYVMTSADMAHHVAEQLENMAASAPFTWGGFFAEEAFRLHHKVPAYGKELSYFKKVPLSDFSCFPGTVVEANQQAFDNRSITGSIDLMLGLEDGLEPVMHGREPVGWVTSSAWIKSLGKTVLMARVSPEFIDKNLTVLVGDRNIPLTR